MFGMVKIQTETRDIQCYVVCKVKVNSSHISSVNMG